MGLDLFYSILSFLFVFTVLVFFHELGHYLVARLNGVRVSVFSIGFGRELLGWNDSHGTRWKVSAIPLGGYVKFFGDAGPASAPDEESALSEEEKAVSFHHKRLGQRAAVVAAGPIANFVLAIAILMGLFMTVGKPQTPAIVESVLPDSAATEAGIQPGDKIVEAYGTDIDQFEELQQVIRLHPGVTMEIVVLRDGRRVALTATPRLQEIEDRFGNVHEIGLLGISTTGAEFRPLPPGNAAVTAVRETGNVIAITFKAVGQMFMGTRSTEELGGPIRIAQMSGDMAREGVATLFMFVAMLSINLGLINIFPIPMLDGGHLLFYGFEALLGRPLSARAQEVGMRIGLTLVLMLMVFATWNDLSNLPVTEFFSKLFS